MISSGVFGEQRRRQGGIVGVVRVRRVDEPVGIAGRQERARRPGAVQQGRGGRRHGYPRREDQRCAQRSARRPHRRPQARQQALRLGRGGGHSPPFFVAGCNRQRNGLLLLPKPSAGSTSERVATPAEEFGEMRRGTWQENIYRILAFSHSPGRLSYA